MDLYVIRHGETNMGKKKLIATEEEPLNENGIIQAKKIGEDLSEELLEDSEKLSTFIDENIHLISSNKPSTKQISFAKNIAKKLKIDLPNELLEDKKLLKDWIDEHNSLTSSDNKLKKKKVQ